MNARTGRKIHVCFVTGTRAEFGLMQHVLRAIQSHPKLDLQLLVTGMHLHRQHGQSIQWIRKTGWTIDSVVPWTFAGTNATQLAASTGLATAKMAKAFEKLQSDIVLVCGDRVEVFAAASAAHVSGRILAHVHGGDRAPGQIDDSLRHAVSKLAHVHFPATKKSADRLVKMGEDRWRVHQVGSPGIDGIVADAESRESLFKKFPNLRPGQFAVVLLHPVDPDDQLEAERAGKLLKAIQRSKIPQAIAIYPNNDPGCAGIINALKRRSKSLTYLLPDVPRSTFLGLVRDGAMLVGNSSSGIIEAASFGTHVVDIGPRQLGRDRSENVLSVPYGQASIENAIGKIWNDGKLQKWRGRNIYGGNHTATRICATLAGLKLDNPLLRRKLISY